ncbi:MAG TPA: hypothetical protein VGF82_15310 [Terracidiphilus sp.]
MNRELATLLERCPHGGAKEFMLVGLSLPSLEVRLRHARLDIVKITDPTRGFEDFDAAPVHVIDGTVRDHDRLPERQP